MGLIITLTTDFGLADEFVGIMKGVILGLAPMGRIVGRVEQIDRFGNLVTNIPGRLLTEVYGPKLTRFKISCGGHEFRGLSRTYSGVPAGEVAAVVGGRDYLELAVNLGRADLLLGGRIGVPVTVTKD